MPRNTTPHCPAPLRLCCAGWRLRTQRLRLTALECVARSARSSSASHTHAGVRWRRLGRTPLWHSPPTASAARRTCCDDSRGCRKQALPLAMRGQRFSLPRPRRRPWRTACPTPRSLHLAQPLGSPTPKRLLRRTAPLWTKWRRLTRRLSLRSPTPSAALPRRLTTHHPGSSTLMKHGSRSPPCQRQRRANVHWHPSPHPQFSSQQPLHCARRPTRSASPSRSTQTQWLRHPWLRPLPSSRWLLRLWCLPSRGVVWAAAFARRADVRLSLLPPHWSRIADCSTT